MNYSRYSLIFLALLLTTCLSGQGFFRVYGPESATARDLIQTSDGGYFLVGHVEIDSLLFLQKTDAAGIVVWTNHLALNRSRAIAATQMPDGGFAVLTEFYQDATAFKNNVLRISATGTVEWMRILDNHFYFANGLRDIAVTSDGGLLLVGDSYGTGLQNVNRLVKLASDGTVVWDKTAGTGFWNTTHLIKLSDGNFGIGGGRNNGDFHLAKINGDGDLIWERSYQKPNIQKAVSLIETIDGGFALLGTNQNPSLGRLEVFLLKTDGNGDEQWSNSIYSFPWPATPAYFFTLSDLTQDAAGNYYIPLADPIELLKLDPSGNPLWKKDLEISGYAWSIIKSSDGNLVLAGEHTDNALLLKVDYEGEFLTNKIKGTVFGDDNVDCLQNSGENGVANFVVVAKESNGATFYRNTNPDGTYEMRVTDGQFTITARPNFGPPGFYGVCDTLEVTVNGPAETIDNQDIGIEALASCPLMQVDLSASLLRRCTTTTYVVNYCNYGNEMAENVQVIVSNDSLLTFVSSNAPFSAISSTEITFEIPDVAPGDCGSFHIKYTVSCNAEIGDVICVDAHILPDTSCVPPQANWDGSQLEVTGTCDGDGISFNFKNTGNAPMTQALDYVIIEDHIMYMQGPIQLGIGGETNIDIPNPSGNGYAGQVLADSDNPTYLRMPVAVVDNCNLGSSSTLPLQLNTSVNSPAFDVSCDQVIGSFDPNDKRGFPLGWGDDHLIERGQDIEYMIRFQNTGNDTAFLVVIRDTLPVSKLDPSSAQFLASSHPALWEISDRGVIKVTFTNILLPDSTTNEPASHGFVSFRIHQVPDLPDGSKIYNSAAIYFDFNEPVITNTSVHTIGRPQLSAVKTPGNNQLLDFEVIPNPFSESAAFVLKNYQSTDPVNFRLCNAAGTVVMETQFNGNTFQLQNQGLTQGLYYFTMRNSDRLLTSGKLVVKN
ncbi:MAG: T9SS type A sorting domain-containing protein [Saprospiraceae bacterium]|nr:T9SS type A sorting domain-containing protein [Saprospiraceae bacterium]